jgi:hypothetical protein
MLDVDDFQDIVLYCLNEYQFEMEKINYDSIERLALLSTSNRLMLMDIAIRIENGEELVPDDVIFDMKKDMRFVNDLLALNWMNEKDRDLINVFVNGKICMLFGGRLSEGMCAVELELFNRSAEKMNTSNLVKKVLFYRMIITGGQDVTKRMKKLSKIIAKHEFLCQLVTEKVKNDQCGLTFEAQIYLEKRLGQRLTLIW